MEFRRVLFRSATRSTSRAGWRWATTVSMRAASSCDDGARDPPSSPHPLPRTRRRMLNREHIFAESEAHIQAHAGERFAVLVLRVPGLREISLRFGYVRGEQSETMAHVKK